MAVWCQQKFLAAVLSVAAAVVACFSPPAHAETSAWKWEAALYAWLPDIEASTRFPTGVDGPTIEVDSRQLIDNLNMTFMGALGARKGRWSAFTDVIYLDESGSRSHFEEFSLGSGQLPADRELDARLDLTAWVWTLKAGYRLFDTAATPVDLYAGLRMLDIEQTLSWSNSTQLPGTDLPGPSGMNRLSGTNWDLVVGARGRVSLGANKRWLLPWQFDLGGGDSDFTWQAMAGLGYRFDWGSLSVNYRYLDYDLGSGTGINDLKLSGPMAALEFHW